MALSFVLLPLVQGGLLLLLLLLLWELPAPSIFNQEKLTMI